MIPVKRNIEIIVPIPQIPSPSGNFIIYIDMAILGGTISGGPKMSIRISLPFIGALISMHSLCGMENKQEPIAVSPCVCCDTPEGMQETIYEGEPPQDVPIVDYIATEPEESFFPLEREPKRLPKEKPPMSHSAPAIMQGGGNRPIFTKRMYDPRLQRHSP